MSVTALLLPLLSTTATTALQTVVVAVLVFAGQYAVARLSNKAQTRSADVDSQTRATEAWQRYAEEMKNRLDSLEAKQTTTEARVRLLELQSVRDLDLIRRLAQRLRLAMAEIRSLGGSVEPEDHELTDLAEMRLSPDQKEYHHP